MLIHAESGRCNAAHGGAQLDALAATTLVSAAMLTGDIVGT